MAEEVGSLVAKLGVDDTGITKSMAELNRQMKIVQSEFQASASKLGDFGKGTDGLKLKAESLTKQIDIQRQRVQALQEQHAKSAEEKGRDARETQNLEVRLNRAQTELSKMETELKSVNDEIVKQTDSWTKLSDSLNSVGDKMKSAGQKMTDTGKALTMTITAPLVAVSGTAIKTASDFETAFAGVRKTVDATEQEFALLKQGIRDMAKDMPQAATEIAKVAENAGQLGIEKDAILDFTRVMVDMGVATNMASEDAAMSLARLATITQMPQDQFDRLGSTIVGLGNDLAATESEIVEMGLRIAGAGNVVGMAEHQILGFSGALAAVGISAEAGGSAFSKLIVDIGNEVATGGDKLRDFASVAGMSAREFQQAFEEDAAMAIVTFIEGLGEINATGGNVFGVLEDLGLTELRLRDALLRAAGAGDLFRNSLDLGARAWEENNALTNEANERYKTTESQFKILMNRLIDISMTLGEALIPALLKAIDAIQPFLKALENMAKWFADLDPTMQGFIITIGAIATAMGPVLIITGQLITSFGTITKTMSTVITAVRALTTAQIGLNVAMLANPIGIVIASLVALGATVYAVIKYWDEIKAFFIGLWNWLKDFFSKWGVEILAIIMPFVGIPLLIFKHWDTLKDGLVKGWEFMLNQAKTIFGSIGNFMANMWNGVKTTTLDVWDSIWGGIKGFINEIIKGVNWMIDGLNSLQFDFPDWMPVVGGKTFGLNIPQIPMLAKGTDYFQGGLAIVGEEGRELVNLPKGSQVIPNKQTEQILSGNQQTVNQFHFGSGAITISAKDIQEFKDVTEFFNSLTQTARQVVL